MASLGLVPHLGDDLGAFLPGPLTEPRGLLPGLGELLLVLLEPLIRLVLRLLGALQAALDGVGPLGQGLLDPRQQDLAEHGEDNDERDGPDDQLWPLGDQRVGWRGDHRGEVFHGAASCR
jgi:hypothetical protein